MGILRMIEDTSRKNETKACLAIFWLPEKLHVTRDTQKYEKVRF